MLIMLQKYVAFKTISKNPQLYLEESRHCAQFLCKLFNNFGAYQTKLLPISMVTPLYFLNSKPIAPQMVLAMPGDPDYYGMLIMMLLMPRKMKQKIGKLIHLY